MDTPAAKNEYPLNKKGFSPTFHKQPSKIKIATV